MEYIHKEQPDKDPDSDNVGDSKTSKKRRKKVTKIAKSSGWTKQFDKEPAESKQEAPSPKQTKIAKKAETKEPAEFDKPTEELVLPEVAPDEYAGELIIAHDDSEAEESADSPETAKEKVKKAANESRLAESRAETEPTVTPETEQITTPETEHAERPEAPETPEVERPEAPAESIAPMEPSPPRVAPPLLFELPPELARRPEIEAERAAASSESTEAEHPGGGEMFDPSRRSKERPAEPVIPKPEARRQARRAEKRGLSRGVLSGGLVGFWLGNRRGKRVTAEKLEPTINDHQKRLEERDRTIEELARERGANRRLTEQRLGVIERTQREFSDFMKRNWETRVLGKQPEKPIASTDSTKPAEVKPQAKETPLIEAYKPVFEPLVEPIEKPAKAEAIKNPIENQPKTEKASKPVEEQSVTEELYAVEKGHRVETSAWHRIEVDEKTGRTVEKPTIDYGEAFKREQQQEKLAANAAKSQTAAQVGMTLLYSGTNETPKPLAPKDSTYQPVAPLNPDKPIGQTIRDNLPYIKQELVNKTTSPITWTVSAIIVALLLAAGVF